MQFSLNESITVLERTPTVMRALLEGLSDNWTMQNEGPETWSPFDVIGHLIHGEKTDWIPRTKIILYEEDKHFVPFDRFAQFRESTKSLKNLLDEFNELRTDNLEELRAMNLTGVDLLKTGIHPEFGEVTLKELLAAWVTHDLGHIVQVSRVMAKQYKEEVGPWPKYLKVLS